MPDVDVTGERCGSRKEIHTEWALLVDCGIRSVAGPHLLPCEQGEAHARRRLWWWQTKRPEANPKLVCQQVTIVYDVWIVVADQTPEELP